MWWGSNFFHFLFYWSKQMGSLTLNGLFFNFKGKKSSRFSSVEVIDEHFFFLLLIVHQSSQRSLAELLWKVTDNMVWIWTSFVPHSQRYFYIVCPWDVFTVISLMRARWGNKGIRPIHALTCMRIWNWLENETANQFYPSSTEIMLNK